MLYVFKCRACTLSLSVGEGDLIINVFLQLMPIFFSYLFYYSLSSILPFLSFWKFPEGSQYSQICLPCLLTYELFFHIFYFFNYVHCQCDDTANWFDIQSLSALLCSPPTEVRLWLFVEESCIWFPRTQVFFLDAICSVITWGNTNCGCS